MSYSLSTSPTEELRLLWRSGHGLIVIETAEERKAFDYVSAAARDRRLYAWSSVQGLVHVGEVNVDIGHQSHDPLAALAELGEKPRPWVAVFHDLHAHLDDARVRRAVRETAETASRESCSLILVSPVFIVPRELESLAAHLILPLPDVARLEQIIRDTYLQLKTQFPDVDAKITRDSLSRLSEALIGSTEDEAARLIRQVVLRDGRLDVHDVNELRATKQRAAANRGLLEVIPVTEDLSDVAGLARLKRWLKLREHAHTPKAREFGLESPKGMLLLGVQGCGKSLCAKVTAGEWSRPLLRLDMGALYNRYIGATEANLRESLRQAEASAPCVLWIDEIEKAFASGGGLDAGDGGVTQRLFATMLSWMNDREADVFITATANDVSRLPPELLRKGRFDEIFFVDLPPRPVRRDIFAIHLRKRGRSPDDFALLQLAERSDGFSGAEIEQAIISALYDAFDRNAQLSSEHIMHALHATSPMSRIMAERITNLRQWAARRCVPAHDERANR